MVQKPGLIDISTFSKKLPVFSTQIFEICMTALEKELTAKKVKTRDEAGGTKSAEMDGF